MTRDQAETVAIAALAFIASNEDQIGRFMAMSGLAPDDLRAQAADPQFLSGVLDFMLQDESLVVGFAAGAGMKPDAVMRARQAFGSMEGVEW